MGDIGIKVSQPGYDVKTAADIEQLFNSSWPLLKIAYEGDYIIANDVDQTIFAHNLGYPAAFFICDYSNGYSTTTPTSNGQIYNGSEQLIYKSSGGAVTLPIKIHFYIYLLDLTSNYQGPVVKQSHQVPGASSSDAGIKVSKPGKDIKSSDLRDYTIHSGAQTPMIHQVVSDITTSTNSGGQSINAIVANHNLGYYPLFFPYVSDGSGNYTFRGNYTQSVPRVYGTTQSTQIELGLTSAPYPNPASLVIFKDPYAVDIPNIVAVV